MTLQVFEIGAAVADATGGRVMASGAGWAWLRDGGRVLHVAGVHGPHGPLTAIVGRLPPSEPGDRVRLDASGARSWRTPPVTVTASPDAIRDACLLVRPHVWNDPRALLLGTVPVAQITDDLVGRGPGLTPAGDDALAGYVYTAVALGRADAAEAAAAARQAAAETGEPSASLLRLAADGEVFAPVGAMLGALVGTNPDALAPALRNLTALGRTTGRAILTGMVRALES